MPLLRALKYLVLVLALVAGGVVPGFAQEPDQAMSPQMQSPCHDMEGEPVAAVPDPAGHGDCCDGGDCRCDCLQHTPASMIVLRPLAPLTLASQRADVDMASRAPAPTQPATRPPIA